MGVDCKGDGGMIRNLDREKARGDNGRVLKGQVDQPSGIEMRKDCGFLETS